MGTMTRVPRPGADSTLDSAATAAARSPMTQQLIADMLGVGRVGVTEANFQAARIIHYMRGRIRVVDRPAPERSVCECSLVVKKEYDRLLPRIPRVRLRE